MSENKMTNQEKRYEEYASTIRTLFFIVGLWPGPGLPKFSIFIIAMYSFSVTVVLFANINFIVHNLTNLEVVTQAMSICISGITAMMKVTLFILNRDEMKRTHENLEKTFRNDFSSAEFRNVLLSPLNYFYHSTFIMSRFFIITPAIFSTGPIISIIIQHAKNAKPIEYDLLFLTKYPWDPKSNTATYVVHYFLESFGAMATGIVSVSVDAGLGFYIFQISTQFRVLSYRLSNLKSSDGYQHLIRECVLRRQILTDCCACLENAYGPVVLWFMISSAISVCANIFQITKMSSESIVTAVLYTIVKLLQALFYGWIGTFLTSETESFRDAVYSSGWAGSGEIPFMTSILIMLMWKPLVLTAWSFSTITLDMFVGILNTAVSYFFLLQTMEESKGGYNEEYSTLN